MQEEMRRIFIPNLPEGLDEAQVHRKFEKFGKILAVELKQRNELGPKNDSLHYGFVNVELDAATLQKCFDEFANKKWKGKLVEIQLAKESFLQKLKRERLAADKKVSTPVQHVSHEGIQPKPLKIKNPKKHMQNDVKAEDETVVHLDTFKEEEEDKNCIYDDIVIINNKFKKVSTKIEGGSGAGVVQLQKPKKAKSMDPYREQADQRRIESLKAMKRGYENQVSLIQKALNNLEETQKNKIIFGEDGEAVSTVNTAQSKNKQLFEDDQEDEHLNFNVKEQFQGKKGKELFDLQSRYKNDSRFQLDSRFVETEESTEEPAKDETNEQRRQMEILSDVLGKKVESKNSSVRKTMRRFDPTAPGHSRYEITPDDQVDEGVQRRTERKKAALQTEAPEVSDTTYFKVDQSALKESLAPCNERFSLLDLFAAPPAEDDDENVDEEEHAQKKRKREENPIEELFSAAKRKKLRTMGPVDDPFQFDSSADEDDGNDIDLKPTAPTTVAPSVCVPEPKHESFFFKPDDYRFQEGAAFIKRFKDLNNLTANFNEMRAAIKKVVKKKVVNYEDKKRSFRKKVSTSRRKKVKRVEKAMRPKQ